MNALYNKEMCILIIEALIIQQVVSIDLKQADIVLIEGTNIISNAIKELTHSTYSHTAGIVKENVIIEAQGFGKVSYERLDKYKGRADVFTCPAPTYWERLNIMAYAREKVGTRFNYVLLILEAGRYLFDYAIPEKKYNSHICSTLWAEAYKTAGIDLCPGIRYPSPGDLSRSKLLQKIGRL